MAYLGRNRPTETTSSVLRSTYTGDGSTTTYNLPGPVANETSIIATINGVTQQDSAYTTNGSQIIFASAPANGDAIELRTISDVGLSYAPFAGSVTTGILADDAVTAGKIATGAVTSAKLASGAAVANIGTRAIGVSQVPAGSVLQVVQSNKFNGVSTTSGSAQFSSTNPSITPSATSSKLLLLWSTSVIIDVDNDSQGSNNGTVTFEYQVGGTGGAWSSLDQFSVPGRGGNGTFTNAMFLLAPSTTSAVYFRFGVSKPEGARNILINDSWGSNRLFMLEIAG
jgi:hypothetical protein